MPTKPKIKIVDDINLRYAIDELYDNAQQVQVAEWALMIAERILIMVDIDYSAVEVLREGFNINRKWQRSEVRMHDVRQAGFKVHKLAREQGSEILVTAMRVAGQAIGTGHMKEHAMVTSDYAVKVVGLVSHYDMEAIRGEREKQIHDLRKILKLDNMHG